MPFSQPMPDDLPTARAMLPQSAWLCLLVWCRSCHHQAPADLEALVDAGRGDVPLVELRFRCTHAAAAATRTTL